MMRKAVVLLSGGLDSCTCLYWTISKGFKVFALLFDYGQKHKKELFFAKKICSLSATPYQVVKIALPWRGSALLDRGMRLPKNRKVREMVSEGIPSTYVPARNTIFLSFALSCADAVGASAVVIGANAIDFSGYPDCRPQYMKVMQRVAELGTRMGSEGRKIEILTPLIHESKAGIIKMGAKLNAPYEWTWSCYEGGGKPCGRCDSCILRSKGFHEAGLKDPLLHR